VSKRTLKIGLVFDDSLDKPDGVQQYVLTLGRWLAREGHEVHYLVGETKRTDIPNLHSLSRNINVRFNHNRMAMPLPVRRGPIRALLEREQFDVLHVQVPYSPAMAARVILAAGPRTAVTGMFHVLAYSNTVAWANRLLGWWLRKSVRRFDLMLSNTTATQAFARQSFHIESQVLPLPLELAAFSAAKPLARYVASLNIVFLGRLVERKGCQHVLPVIVDLRSQGVWPPNARFIICGAGPLAAQLRTYVAEHDLTDIVEFAGHISETDKPRYLAAADIAIYPSTGGESFGIVLLEAMAASRGAVLGGQNPGYASVLAPHTESLFDPYNTPALAAKLLDLLQHASTRAAYSDWQHSYVKQFDITQIGHQTVELFAQALHKRRG